MYSCEASVCGAIKQYVAKIRESRDHLKDRGDRRIVDRVLSYIGQEGSSGPHYIAESLQGKSVAQTDQKGTTRIDVDKASTSEDGAGYLGHEAQHEADRGSLADTADEVTETETNAYATQAVVAKGLGALISKGEQAMGVKSSVEIWLQRQEKPAEQEK